MKVTSILFIFTLFFLGHTQAQQVNFSIQYGEDNIGQARVWVDKNLKQDLYAFQVDGSYVLPLGITSITSMYEDGKLLSSSYRMDDAHINIKGDGQFYHMMNGEEYTPIKSDWVELGIAKLFCERPIEGQRLLEGEGQVGAIHQKSADIFELQLANDIEMVFTYRFNDCIGVTISQEGKEWKLTRMNEVTL